MRILTTTLLDICLSASTLALADQVVTAQFVTDPKVNHVCAEVGVQKLLVQEGTRDKNGVFHETARYFKSIATFIPAGQRQCGSR